MKYNTKKEYDILKLRKRIDALISNQKTVKVEEVRMKRSTSQNSLYWLWLTCIESETGNDKNDLHKYFALKYLGTEKKEIFGEVQEVIKSTPDNNTKEFTDYLNKIKLFADVDLGIGLPDPETKHFEDFYNEYA